MTSNLMIFFAVAVGLIAVASLVLVYFAYQQAQANVETLVSRKRLEKVFLQADNSFKKMIDSFQDIENLQEIRQRVDLMTAHLVDMHGRIDSQLDTSGRIIQDLHQLIKLWSEEGNELQRSYQALSQVLEQSLAQDLKQREELAGKLETLIQAQARK